MNFNKHSNLIGQHAFLGASNYHWLNYDQEKLQTVYTNMQMVQRGTRLHSLAKELIELGVKLPKTKATLNMYVNDAIGYRMTPEQVLYFSENCFGTADAISFKSGLLRIHDYKSGTTPASMKQLEIYNALFCLEYGYKPFDIQSELRIYQANEILVEEPDPENITYIMDKIITFDKYINKLKEEAM